ncbi:MAG: response regulator transcription factor [Lachnospiraceae bacterium]|nr:response regulator transcription factor [Lachnospiraceae bacterium]
MSRILIVEDEAKIARFVELELIHEGYEVQKAPDGRTGLDMALQEDYDLILLDVMLPGLNGIEVLRRLRQQKSTPVILLTARDAVMDKVSGLDAGADDYITKPFAIEELLARIRVAERHHEGDEKSRGARIEIGPVSLDEDRHEVTVNGEPVYLTNHEFLLLQALMENKNIVMDRARLIEKVCGYDYVGETNVIDVYVRYLRTKIDDRYGINLIRTVRGVGYVIREDLDQK